MSRLSLYTAPKVEWETRAITDWPIPTTEKILPDSPGSTNLLSWDLREKLISRGFIDKFHNLMLTVVTEFICRSAARYMREAVCVRHMTV